MSTLPILLKNPRILLLGGGPVALQKACVLKENTIEFSCIAQHFIDDFHSLEISLREKSIHSDDLSDFNIIVDATASRQVAELLCHEKRQRFLLVNRVDAPQQCDFYFSSLLNYGPLKIAVSTDGASPTIGRIVRDKIKQLIPDDFSELVEEKAEQRKVGIIEPELTERQALKRLAQVFLIGCGPGDVRLLTLQAYQCIQQMDVVLYDHLISDEILAFIPSTVERVYVGKQKDAHSVRQQQINEMILDYARQGLKVARLKSGDPYIFGRGAEEAQFLAEQGVRVEVIAGISSALAGPASSGIPLTARGYAANLSIVSAHLSGSRINSEWLPLLKLSYHTTVVLMGLSFAAEITRLALDSGVNPQLPVAIISNASRPDQHTVITTVEQLAVDSLQAQRPAVLVFGEVVNLHQILPHYDQGRS
ncbi:MAG: uroporphyrinogen-III C-methyltransferase [Desulfuromonas sp.]|nr:uroporphyrinogen-III C-methyltransferase [Desulfuromonas sp.]